MGWKIARMLKGMNPVEQVLQVIGLIITVYALVSLPYPYNLSYPYNVIFSVIIGVLYIVWLKWSTINNIIYNSPVELSDKWFKEKYESYLEPFTDKFSFEAELHTKTSIDDRIHEFLLDDEFLIIYEKFFSDVKKDLKNFNNALIRLDNDLPQESELISEKLKLVEKANEIKKNLNDIINELFNVLGLLKNGNFSRIKEINFQELYDNLELIFREFEKLEKGINFSNINFIGTEEEIDEAIKISEEIIAGPSDTSLKFLNDFGVIINKLKGLNKVDLHLLGDAGVGKSHIVNFICKERLDKGLPVLIVSGRRFSNDSPIEEQLKVLLYIQNSWQDFIDTLEKVAISKKTRIPIIIDGLNEATLNNAFSNLWKDHLNSFIHSLKSKNNLVLITTCRTTYKDYIWGRYPDNYLIVRGFNSVDVKTAVNKYFKFYKIVAKLGIVSINHFKNPLYLRIFCEVTNSDRRN